MRTFLELYILGDLFSKTNRISAHDYSGEFTYV